MRVKPLLAIVIAGALVLISLNFLKTHVGDVRPALLPPPSDIGKVIEKQETPKSAVGEPTEFPLNLPSNFSIGVFAKNLGNARDLTFSAGGTLLLSIPGSGKVVALPDSNNDGRADEIKDALTGLEKPHGIAFHNGKLFVVEEGKVVRYLWNETTLAATKDRELFTLPQGGRHFTRAIAFDESGSMFISLGSSCDVCLEKHEWLAAVIVSNENGNSPRIFVKGLRNAVFITTNPTTDELWGTEMGRDFLGDNLPPDEINIIRDGADYGWPVCYGNKIHDTKFDKNTYIRDPCENTAAPVYQIPAHSAPLGLTFIDSPQFPKEWQGDLLVAYHGSWNSSTPVGYKVVRLNVQGNSVIGEEDFLTGFLKGSEALGRPVDIVFDPSTRSGQAGSLFISDDKAGVVYKVKGVNH